jgi:hypothetical protein
MELMLDSDRKLRYEYYELFDAGNIDDNGNILEPDSPRAQYNKVSESNLSISRITDLYVIGEQPFPC